MNKNDFYLMLLKSMTAGSGGLIQTKLLLDFGMNTPITRCWQPEKQFNYFQIKPSQKNVKLDGRVKIKDVSIHHTSLLKKPVRL